MTEPRHLRLTREMRKVIDERLARWEAQRCTERLWARDPSLWTGGDEALWLGWLDIVDRQLEGVERFSALRREIEAERFTDAILLGMGGSSLCAEVLRDTLGRRQGAPDLRVLDSTDPSQIRTVESSCDLARTLFIVSSKSGTTLEPNLLLEYFRRRLEDVVGIARVGERIVAITDPGSPLEETARRGRFRAVCHGDPRIGGRYSALSDFGMIPAALMGLDVADLLRRARAMVQACRPGRPAGRNPGVHLGLILGTLARGGRDKVSLILSPGLAALGAWLEQLLAESTGKLSTGLLPIDGEPLGEADRYGPDRQFVQIVLRGEEGTAAGESLDRLAMSGHPVVRIEVEEIRDIGAEFFRWEIATAVAGSILGVHPFDQPDVEASKVRTRMLTDRFEQEGELPRETPIAEIDGLRLYADPGNASRLTGGGTASSGEELLSAHLGSLRENDYFALLAYVERNERNEAVLREIRASVRDGRGVATSVGFGPRFLHSTGQAYKGGPAGGVFLQITCEEVEDLPIPGRKARFGVVKAAQARGDLEVLAEREQRALRIDLGLDVEGGLRRLARAIRKAL